MRKLFWQTIAVLAIISIVIGSAVHGLHKIKANAIAAEQTKVLKEQHDNQIKEYLKKQAQRLQLPEDWPEPFRPPSPDMHKYDKQQNYPDGLDHA